MRYWTWIRFGIILIGGLDHIVELVVENGWIHTIQSVAFGVSISMAFLHLET